MNTLKIDTLYVSSYDNVASRYKNENLTVVDFNSN